MSKLTYDGNYVCQTNERYYQDGTFYQVYLTSLNMNVEVGF